MGCGASSKNYVKKGEDDATLPERTSDKAVRPKNLQDVITEQKEISDVNKGGVRLAKIIRDAKVEDNYENLKVLGTGMSGAVYRAKNRTTGTQVALKQIKTTVLSISERGRLYNEVHVALLMDHPNIMKLLEVYETNDSLALCSEICEGGALLDYISMRKHLQEPEASRIAKQMLLAVSYMHSPATPGGQMCHRDLKLENFMFVTPNYIEPHLKLIDFGLSRICEKGSEMTLFAGSLHYFAPELLDRRYDFRCDLWALGVTVYIMLFGVPPFTVKSTKITYQRIRAGKYRLHRDISSEARDFLKRLIHTDPEQRTPAKDMVEHAWITMHAGQVTHTEPAVSPELANALHAYATNGVFKRAVLKFVSLNMPASQLKDLRNTFAAIDVGHDGVVTLQEFTNALEKSLQTSAESGLSTLSSDEIKDVFHKLDLNKTETISYSEFLAACLQAKFDLEEYRLLLRDVFQKFDRDGSGFISAEDLREVLGDEYNAARVEDLVAECDRDKDGKINLNEFLSHLSACVAADAVNPEKDDGLAGSLDVRAASEEINGDENADIVQADGEAKAAGEVAEAAHRRWADAFKVVSALVATADAAKSTPCKELS